MQKRNLNKNPKIQLLTNAFHSAILWASTMMEKSRSEPGHERGNGAEMFPAQAD